MTLLESLLDAIVRLEGDALVMHVGEKPYVVTTSSSMNAYRGPLAWGQVELSSRVLTPEAVMSMVAQILPVDQRQALDELGAIEHGIVAPSGVPDRFSIVAARGGDDIWLELRRHPLQAEPAVAQTAEPSTAAGQIAAAAAAGEAAWAAVGVQEPPGGFSAPAMARAGEPEAPAADLTIEERVHVIDEAGQDFAEHVEHVVIPVPPEAAGAEEESTLEVVEPEVQHAPTDEDVEALLASTAAALLTSERPPDGAGIADAAPPPEFVMVEDEHIAGEIAADAGKSADDRDESDAEEAVDLTAELNEIPRPPERMIEMPVEAAEASPSIPEAPAAYAATPAAASEATDSRLEPADQLPVPTTSQADPSEPWRAPAPARSLPVEVLVEPERPGEPVVAETRQDGEASEVEAPFNIEISLEPEISAVAPSRPPVGGSAFAEPPGVAASAETPDMSTAPVNLAAAGRLVQPTAAEVAVSSHSVAPQGEARVETQSSHAEVERRRGVVVPLSRGTSRPDAPAAGARLEDAVLLETLRAASERGASIVYVVANSKPMIRVDGEIGAIENGAVLSGPDVERLIASLAPPQLAESAKVGAVEWISEAPDVGRVRCVTFRDHRGPGLILRIVSSKSISADHLALSAEIRDLCAQTEGLVLVAGPRGSGRSTLLAAFVDLVNRTRSDHIISIEQQIGFVHESRRSFVSQREVPGEQAVVAAAVHGALKEDPDVLVVEEVHSAEVASAVLEAAESGRLVFVSMTAASAADAVHTFVELFPEAQRSAARASLAGSLRAVVAQMLLRRLSGGRTAARELLLNTPAVSTLILEGKSAELPAALESGRRHGMVPLTGALATLVREGTVHGAEAYRKAPDRSLLLAALAREGVDASFAERLA